MRSGTFTANVERDAKGGGTTVVTAPKPSADDTHANAELAHASAGEPKRDEINELAGARALVRDDARFLVLCASAAFLARLILAAGVEQAITPDGVAYATLARALAAGDFSRGMSTYWPPLYPALVALSSFIFHDIEFAGRFVSVVAGTLLVVPVYLLARLDYGKRVARLAAALAALHPLLVYYSTLVLTEATYTTLFASGVVAGRFALRRGARAWAFLWAGASFGACYLLKPEAAGFVLLLVAMTLGARLFDRQLSLKKTARDIAALCGGFLLLAAPYLVYLRAATGRWALSGKLGGHLWQGSRRAGEAAPPRVDSLMPDVTTAVTQLTKALRYEYEVFNLIFPTAFVILVGLALFRAPWTRARARREFYLFAFIVATLAGYAVTLPNIRFLVPLLPLLICWVAKGIFELDEWARTSFGSTRGEQTRRLLKHAVAPLALAVLMVSLAPLSVYLLRGDKWGDYGGQKRAALWIREKTEGRAARIMSTVPVAAFYAGGEHVVLADTDYAEFIAGVRRTRAEFVIANERELKHMRLRTLLDESAPHEGLRLIHRVELARGHRILVYEVEGATENNRTDLR